MDRDRFEELVRLVARSGSRRGFGRGVVSGVLVALLGDTSFGLVDTEAKPARCRRKRKAGTGKRPGRQCCRRKGGCRKRKRPARPKRRPPVHVGAPVVGGCAVFPANNVWNTRISHLPVHPKSDAFIRAIGLNEPLGPDFSMPYAVVPHGQPKVDVIFDGGANDIHNRYPIPPNPPIEPGVDRHVIVVESGVCMLYELYDARADGDGWRAYSGASWALASNALRPDGMTSADAAGLPILAGLLRYNEVAAGFVGHAIRFTSPRTRADHVWPARKHASYNTDPNVPSMGQRFRLKANFDISGFSPLNQVILTALKHYGFILADNGGPWVFQGVPDARWREAHLEELRNRVHGRDFEAVVGTALMIHPDSGQARAG